ncbi:MAG: DUF1801 domain-containing protein [Acidimicrobiales bacterium]|nr:DUF1801 domain-containing protein [Acidimicrobiales bacterium]
MAADEIDAYLENVPEPGRSTLEEMRRRILAVVPEAEQCISYQMPAFRVPGPKKGKGKVVAGFAAFAKHLSYLPHSGTILPSLDAELAGHQRTKSSLHFAFDEPLPADLVATLVRARLAEIEATGH